MRKEKIYHDGAIVIVDGVVRKRLPVFMSLVGIGSPKLMRHFKEAKVMMKESNFMRKRIEIELPKFNHEVKS